MANSIGLKIVTPNEIFFNGDVDILTIKTLMGTIGLMKNQIPFISFIKPCAIIIKDINKNISHRIAIGDGIVYNNGDNIQVITKDIISLNKSNLNKKKKELGLLQEKIKNIDKDSLEYSKIDDSIKKTIRDINLIENT